VMVQLAPQAMIFFDQGSRIYHLKKSMGNINPFRPSQGPPNY